MDFIDSILRASVGSNLLKQSHYRFFAPVPTGQQQDGRQTTLVHEGGGPSHPEAAGGGNGHVRKQVSGVIGTYRWMDQLPSSGIEDQFSKSGYGKDAYEYLSGSQPPGAEEGGGGAYFGLVETRAPGLYTPRKQAERLREQAAYEEFMRQSYEAGQGPASYPGLASARDSARGSARGSARLSARLATPPASARGAASSQTLAGPGPGVPRALHWGHKSTYGVPASARVPQLSARASARESARRESEIAAVRALD